MSQRKTNIIAFFNNKGGVSKTTTCFNLGWMLASEGKTVVMVDADPQCNLTGLALEVEDDGLLPESYQKYAKVNLHDSLLPALKSTGTKITAPDCHKVAGNDNLYLLPGNVRLAEVETQLATAMSVGSVMPAMQNVPGSFSKLYSLVAEKYQADYILIDMSPSLGALNQVNFLSSDYFIVPMMPDVFSVMAIDSLSQAIPRWVQWSVRARQLGIFVDQDLVYKFEPKAPKFLGTVIQRYRLRNAMPSRSFEEYFDFLATAVDDIFVPAMEKQDLMLDANKYQNVMENYRLAEIPDFNSLIACSQRCHKPVYELTDSDLTTGGAALLEQKKKVDSFKEIFEGFATRVNSLVA